MADPLILTAASTATEAVDTIPCGLCRRQFSKYTCPTCNVGYCALTCFRSEAHSQCSETFYRKEVETGIQIEPSKSAEEKMKMMDLLKRLEQESTEENPNLLEEDDDDDEDLAQRLDGMDIESATPDALWAMLTSEEREKFMKALDNPNSELAQQLLASEELGSDSLEPWWEAPSLEMISQKQHIKRYGTEPASMIIPPIKPGTKQTTYPLVYNIVALCIAYAYTTRYLSTSPLSALKDGEGDYQEARRIISELVPFLTNRTSKILHSNLSSVVTDLWSRFEPNQIDGKMMSTLLADATKLLRPRQVTVMSSTTSTVIEPQGGGAIVGSHPSAWAILVLSDLSKLFEPSSPHKEGAANQRQNHITLKISFYAAQIISTPPVILSGLSEELRSRSKAVERDVVPSMAIVREAGPAASSRTDGTKQPRTPKIEELS